MKNSEKYSCPMHPEVTSNMSGMCPKCGMKLTEENFDEKEHPMQDGGNDSHHMHEGNGSHDMHAGHEMLFKRNFFIGLPITFVILLLSPKIQEWFSYSISFPGTNLLIFALSTIMVFYLGKPFYQMGWGEIITKKFGMMTLVSLAVLSGYTFSVAATFIFSGESLYWEVATLVLAFLLGHWIEMRAVRSATGALEELVKLIPQYAHLIKGKNFSDIKTSELKIGDMIIVKPGEKIPTDGIVSEGESSVNESLLTGESKPVTKESNDPVIGGSINGDGSLTVRVEKVGSTTVVSQMIDLVKTAKLSKPKVQRLADRAATLLTFVAIVVGLGTFAYWFFINPQGAVFASTLAISVVVITCPHALGLAIPTVTTITSSIASKNGLLIQDMKAIEIARKIDYIVFDKTGTLTKGNFSVTNIITKDNFEEYEILSLAASVEYHSQHSVAGGILSKAKERKLKISPASKFMNISGKGARGNVGKDTIYVGNKKLIKDWFDVKDAGTVVYVSKNDKTIGAIVLSDEVRPEAKKAVKSLQDMNIKVAMLTGDKKEVAYDISEKLGIDTVFSEVLPEEKVEKIRQLQRKGNIVAVVGDGINDAAALTQANLGLAIGAGTAVASSSAEIVLIKNDLMAVAKSIKLSRITSNKMMQNIAWATGYNVIAIPLAAGVLVPYGISLRPEWSALIMSASSVIVVANAFLLKRVKL